MKKEKLTMRNLANQIEEMDSRFSMKFNIIAAALVGTWIGWLVYYLSAV